MILTASSAQAQEPSPPYEPRQVPVPESAPVAGGAADAYARNCAPCHGVRGAGDGPAGTAIDPTVFSDPQAVWERSPAELFFTTKFGRIEKLMPPWRNTLNDEQIWQAVYYAWALHTDEEEVAAGAELYAQSCAACHGDKGRGDGPAAGSDMPDFSEQAAMIFLSQAELERRWRGAHPRVGADWSAGQRRAALEFIRTFTYQPIWAPPLLSGPGVIAGQLLQGTADGPAPSQDAVTLNIYRQTSLLATRAAAVDPGGGFLFRDLPVDSGYYFLVETAHRGIRYTSPIMAFTGPDFAEGRVAPDRIETSLAVYETTTDHSGVRIGRANWIIEHEPGSLLVGQVSTFSNRSDRTFVGIEDDALDVPVTIALPLPATAQDIEFQDGQIGEVYRRSGQIVYDTRPIPPGDGSRQVFVRFRLPFDGNSTEIAFPVLYDTELVNLLVADLPTLEVDVSFTGDARPATGQDTIRGVLFRRWSAPVSAGAALHVSLRGLIEASARDPRPGAETLLNRELPVAAPPLDTRIPLAFGAIIGLALLASLLASARRERARSAPAADQVVARRAELISQIARLDDLHALGELDEKAWQRKRARLRGELLAIAQAGEEAQTIQ